jgi:hypothetical protein
MEEGKGGVVGAVPEGFPPGDRVPSVNWRSRWLLLDSLATSIFSDCGENHGREAGLSPPIRSSSPVEIEQK